MNIAGLQCYKVLLLKSKDTLQFDKYFINKYHEYMSCRNGVSNANVVYIG